MDGIVLRQLLQWHTMLSNWLPPTTMEAMQRDMVWDGLLYAVVWLVTLLGVWWLWSAAYDQEAMPSVPAASKPTICLDVISLVASSCGQDSGQTPP